MFDILLQDSLADWFMPLMFAAFWMMRWKLFLHAHSIQASAKMEEGHTLDLMRSPKVISEKPQQYCAHLMKTVKRKECPDDSDVPHFSI